MEWKLTKNELPEENVYVLVHIKNEFNNCGDVENYYAVARIEKGITEEERDKMLECERKRIYYPGDVHGNNLVPYRWSTIGPDTFFGQEVDKWIYIDDIATIDNADPSKSLESLNNLLNWDGVCKAKFALYYTIKQDLLKSQEEKKVLNVIKEKCLYNDNLNWVAVCINYDMYKEEMSKKHDTVVVKINWNDKVVLDCLKLLTQKEFDILKRWQKRWQNE